LSAPPDCDGEIVFKYDTPQALFKVPPSNSSSKSTMGIRSAPIRSPPPRSARPSLADRSAVLRQASPTPSPAVEVCFGSGVSGQSSSASGTPSPSRSGVSPASVTDVLTCWCGTVSTRAPPSSSGPRRTTRSVWAPAGRSFTINVPGPGCAMGTASAMTPKRSYTLTFMVVGVAPLTATVTSTVVGPCAHPQAQVMTARSPHPATAATSRTV